MEQVTGVEPVSQPWEGRVLPMYYTCLSSEEAGPKEALAERPSGLRTEMIIICESQRGEKI